MRIIRKIGEGESYFLITKDFHVITYALDVCTQFDFIKHEEQVRESIKLWQQMHPMLRCIVKKIDEKNYFVEANHLKPCVELIEIKEEQEEEMLRRSNGEITNNQKSLLEEFVCELLIEREVSMPFDVLDQDCFLWRLKIFPCKTSSKCKLFFSVHHIIMDGVSVYTSLLQLLEIIEYLALNQTKEHHTISLPHFNALQNVVELMFDKLVRFQDLSSRDAYAKVPDFIDPIAAKQESIFKAE
jgi:hypothetical protein